MNDYFRKLFAPSFRKSVIINVQTIYTIESGSLSECAGFYFVITQYSSY